MGLFGKSQQKDPKEQVRRAISHVIVLIQYTLFILACLRILIVKRNRPLEHRDLESKT